jgi:hypothetical protein
LCEGEGEEGTEEEAEAEEAFAARVALLRVQRLQRVHAGAAEQAPLQKALAGLLAVRCARWVFA